MNLSELESLVLFLAHHKRLWAAHCRDMQVDPDRVAKLLAEAHARLVQEGM